METNLNQVFKKEEEIYNEISKLKSNIKQINLFKTILYFIFFLSFIVLGILALKGIIEYKKVNEYNKRLILLINNEAYKQQIEKNLTEIINDIKIVHKLEGLKWIDFTKDEIKKITVELLIGEIYYKIEYKKVLAYISSESFWYKKAYSRKGAKGLMQLIKSTYYECLDDLAEDKINEYDVVQNIRCGIHYIHKCRYRLKNGTSIYKGIYNIKDKHVQWAFNAGYRNVLENKWYKYENDVYDETKDYCKKINFYFNNYKQNKYDVYYYNKNKRYNNK